MPMISSLANAQVKHIRRLQNDKRFRYREKTFVIEGTRLLLELIANPSQAKKIYYTQDWLADPNQQAILEEAELGGELVTNEVMAEMSTTETASGVLASAAMNQLPVPAQPTMLLILDAVTTPGNMGTMLRTAGASAVDAVLLAPGCVDIYNPKVIRGAMGAHFRLPLRHCNWQEISEYCDTVAVWLSDTNGTVRYTDIDWQQPSALIVGNEARGAGKEAQLAAQGTAIIPMADATESLNAATAAAVILFEAFRQRGFTASADDGISL